MKKKSTKKFRRAGFTLVELLIVLVIIGALAAVVFAGGATPIKQAHERRVQSDLKNLGTYVQDMMYNHPDLQFLDAYNGGEYYTYDPATKKFAGAYGTTPLAWANDDDAIDLNARKDPEKMAVLTLLFNYLTDDFQLGKVKDSWDTPYCFSYAQSKASKSGEASSCIVVINSFGSDSLDDTSAGASIEAQRLTELFKAGMDAEVVNGNEKWSSASAFLEDANIVSAIESGDDYGLVVVMINGQVSTSYYGF